MHARVTDGKGVYPYPCVFKPSDKEGMKAGSQYCSQFIFLVIRWGLNVKLYQRRIFKKVQ